MPPARKRRRRPRVWRDTTPMKRSSPVGGRASPLCRSRRRRTPPIQTPRCSESAPMRPKVWPSGFPPTSRRRLPRLRLFWPHKPAAPARAGRSKARTRRPPFSACRPTASSPATRAARAPRCLTAKSRPRRQTGSKGNRETRKPLAGVSPEDRESSATGADSTGRSSVRRRRSHAHVGLDRPAKFARRVRRSSPAVGRLRVRP